MAKAPVLATQLASAIATDIAKITDDRTFAQISPLFRRTTVTSVTGAIVTCADTTKAGNPKYLPLTAGDEVYLLNITGNPRKPGWIVVQAVGTYVASDLGLFLATDQVTPANGTALQDIPDLTFALGANEKWVFEAYLITYVSTGTLGIKFRPVLSQTPSLIKIFFNAPTTGYTVADVTKVTANNTSTTKALAAFTHNGTDNSYVRINGTIVNGPTPATFKLQYANNNGTGSSVVYIEAGSSMRAKRAT